jgi:hypothetical protein
MTIRRRWMTGRSTGRTRTAPPAIASAAARRRQARDDYAHLIPTMLELRAAGRSLAQVAADLNDQGHETRREKHWSKTQVRRMLDRAQRV